MQLHLLVSRGGWVPSCFPQESALSSTWTSSAHEPAAVAANAVGLTIGSSLDQIQLLGFLLATPVSCLCLAQIPSLRDSERLRQHSSQSCVCILSLARCGLPHRLCIQRAPEDHDADVWTLKARAAASATRRHARRPSLPNALIPAPRSIHPRISSLEPLEPHGPALARWSLVSVSTRSVSLGPLGRPQICRHHWVASADETIPRASSFETCSKLKHVACSERFRSSYRAVRHRSAWPA